MNIMDNHFIVTEFFAFLDLYRIERETWGRGLRVRWTGTAQKAKIRSAQSWLFCVWIYNCSIFDLERASGGKKVSLHLVQFHMYWEFNGVAHSSMTTSLPLARWRQAKWRHCPSHAIPHAPLRDVPVHAQAGWKGVLNEACQDASSAHYCQGLGETRR